MKLPRYRLSGSSVVNVIGVVAVVYLVVMLGQTIKRNYELNQQIIALNQQVSLLQAKKDQMTYDIQYYKTNSFRERQARAQLGLQLPGENVIIVPQKSPSASTQVLGDQTARPPARSRSNLQQWLDFMSGRS
jgi:cell division protein FtsB